MAGTRTIIGRSLFTEVQWQLIARALELSDREFQIVRCLFDDEIEASIARRLGISVHTVHTYMVRLYRKLGVSSRCELIVRVMAEHLASQQTSLGRR